MNVVPDTRRRAGHHLGCDDYRAKQREAHWVQGGEGTAGWLSLLACPHRAGRDPTNTHVASLAWTGRGQAQRNQDPAWILLASPDLQRKGSVSGAPLATLPHATCHPYQPSTATCPGVLALHPQPAPHVLPLWVA